MRLPSKIALGGGVASAATALGLLASGVLAGSATLIVLDPVAPAARASELTTFDSCDALKDWYVKYAVSEVGPYGWKDGSTWGLERTAYVGGAVDLAADSALKVPAAVSPQGGGVTGSATGTNTQEAAVDEPDVAKTNGSLVARILNDRTLVLLDVTGARPEETGRLALPRNGYGNELLLIGTHVLVVQQTWSQPEAERTPGASDSRLVYRPGRVATRLFDVDVSDPTAPRMVSRDRYSGRILSARQYGDTVRLVTATPRPELRWTYPGGDVSEREATRRNRALVRDTPVERWMPSVLRDGERENLIDCASILHPKKFAGSETVAVTTFPAAATAQRSSVAVTAGGGITYSSPDRLYVATSDHGSSGFRDLVVREARQTTGIHAFALDGTRSRYVGSGVIDGYLRDRWSLDEHEGRLRVAWTTPSKSGRSTNGITVLTEKDGDLEPTATVDDLGVDEDIQSVRWFDHLAVLVTFRQTDPLYTIDLTDADHPKVLGALKIPGYSGYLHPIGDDLLLGLGVSGDEDGNTGGAQAAVFDISNLRKPVRVGHVTFPRETYLGALEDPRAFSWLGSGTAVTPLSNWSGAGDELLELQVTPAGRLTSSTLTDLEGEDGQTRTLPLPDGRITVLDGDQVRLLRP